MTRIFAVTTATLALVALPALAIEAEIDLDGDGTYNLSEVQTAMPDMTFDSFNVIDVNGDGLLDADEVAAAVQAGLLPDPAS